MTHRERMLAVLERRAPDRIPWSPRIDLWLSGRAAAGTLPARYRGLSLREIERDLGIAHPARAGRIFRQVYDGVRISERTENGRTVTTYETPVGSVRTVLRKPVLSEQSGMASLFEEYPLETPRDYRVWEYVTESLHWEPRYDDYREYDAEVGDDGLPMVSVGDVPFHFFLQKLAGYEHGYYHLADHPELVEGLLQTMTRVERERLWPVVEQSPARFLLHGAHFSSQITPPPFFERHIEPYYRELMPRLHGSGKVVAMHGDADLSLLLQPVERCGWDVLECFVTAPMVPLTLEEARRVWGTRVVLWGGLPSLLLNPSTPESEFRSYMERLLRIIAPGDGFVLGVSDNVLPDSDIERVRWVTGLLEENGRYPLPEGPGES